MKVNLGLKELSSLVGMSPHYFSQLFKQSTGTTPHQYVISRRIARAKQLLTQNQLSIDEVAQTVGFCDRSHLHRHFKRALGITPKNYQQLYQ